MPRLGWLLCLPVLVMGCEQFKGAFTRQQLPDLGPRLSTPVTISFDRALLEAKAPYVDACGSPHELPIGQELEATILDGAYQNFQVVDNKPGTPPAQKPEMDIQLSLTRSGWKILTDGVYDRLPAELTLEALAIFRDAQGNVKGSRTFTTIQKGRLMIEPTQRRCIYVNADALLHDGATDLASQFLKEARAQAQGQPATADRSGAPVSQSAAIVPGAAAAGTAGTPSPVSFKATLIDEDGNGTLQGGERVKIRVDVVNDGAQPLSRVTVKLTGTPSLVSQFPATTMTVHQLQPGEVKSVDFATTLAASVSVPKADFEVSIADIGPSAPAAQALSASVRPMAGTTTDIDHVSPSAKQGFQHPHTFLVSIGLSSHREQDAKGRKYAALDAEMVATYFKTVGGVPSANVRLLQDWKALRADIEEALLDWLPARISEKSLVIVYFSGHVVGGPTGDLYLVPYDGTPGSLVQAYPLKDLQTSLSRLRAAHTVFLFDGNVTRSTGEARSKIQPQWDLLAGNHLRVISTTGFARSLESDKLRHGLFTYYLLRGMKGEADQDSDGDVTISELIAFLRDRVPPASRGELPQLQVPMVTPSISKIGKAASLSLAKSGDQTVSAP